MTLLALLIFLLVLVIVYKVLGPLWTIVVAVVGLLLIFGALPQLA